MWTVKGHRALRKQQAIEYLGGKCLDCGNEDKRVLEFDHAKKRRSNGPTIASLFDGSWQRLQKELDNCELVCANCHKTRHIDRPKFVNGD